MRKPRNRKLELSGHNLFSGRDFNFEFNSLEIEEILLVSQHPHVCLTMCWVAMKCSLRSTMIFTKLAVSSRELHQGSVRVWKIQILEKLLSWGENRINRQKDLFHLKEDCIACISVTYNLNSTYRQLRGRMRL